MNKATQIRQKTRAAKSASALAGKSACAACPRAVHGCIGERLRAERNAVTSADPRRLWPPSTDQRREGRAPGLRIDATGAPPIPRLRLVRPASCDARPPAEAPSSCLALQALEGGRLGGIATDVMWEEPFPPEDPVVRGRAQLLGATGKLPRSSSGDGPA